MEKDNNEHVDRVNHIEISAEQFATSVRRKVNDIQRSHFFKENSLDPGNKLLVFSTGFVMTVTGIIIQPELPSYAQPLFWLSVEKMFIRKHSIPPPQLQSQPQLQPQPQQAFPQQDIRPPGTTTTVFSPTGSPQAPETSEEKAPDAIVMLQKISGQYVLTRANGDLDSNPDLEKLLTMVGTTVEAIQESGATVLI